MGSSGGGAAGMREDDLLRRDGESPSTFGAEGGRRQFGPGQRCLTLHTWGLRIENGIRRDELTYVWTDGGKFSHVLYEIIPFRLDPMGPLPKKIVVTDPMSPCRRY